MSLFKRKKTSSSADNQSALAEMALKSIHDGVIITDKNGVVEFINPAAVTMTGHGSNSIGLDYGLLIKLESKEGRTLADNENPLIQAMKNSQPLEKYQASLIVGQSDKRIPVAISILIANNVGQNRIITFRNITKELEEEGEQTEFISTASHEMRTPVATIDGYLSLSLNPQTATIDERARGYLTAAQNASKHLGKLFRDLLDVTKLDDGRIRPNFVPVEMVSLVKDLTKDYAVRAKEAKLNFTFGSDSPSSFSDNRKLNQVIYGFVDVDFMREIMGNLIDNAIKYTPDGGSIYVNVRGDGDRVLINVTDTGIGISSEDLAHIFQKFYRSDNSDTRTIGGSGLGLYLVKQRTEAMGGKVWAESAFGDGSTFYVSLPRLSNDEYEKRMIMIRNREIQEQIQSQKAPQAAMPTPGPAPAPVQQAAPIPQATPTPSQPAPQPVQQATSIPPRPAPQAIQPTLQAQQVATQPPAPPAPPMPPTPSAPPAQNQSETVQNQTNINLNGEAK